MVLPLTIYFFDLFPDKELFLSNKTIIKYFINMIKISETRFY